MTLRLENLVIHDNSGHLLFEPTSFAIEPGTIGVVMGPSGCGKSTMLSLIAGHLADDFQFQGEVTLNDVAITQLPAHQRKIGFLFQDDLLFPHLNIWQNLAYALPNQLKKQEREQQAKYALERVGLKQIAESYPEQISGGQKARVSLVRTLLAQPSAVLLDEPFSKLDKTLRIQFREWVFAQLQAANIPCLLVTHDEDDIPTRAQQIKLIWNLSNA